MISSDKVCDHLTFKPKYDQVTELNLSNLKILKIEIFPFEQFPNLRTLDLSYNELTLIDNQWSKSHKILIENLNLSFNKLETLLFLKGFQYLKHLNVTENSLRNNERFLSLYLCPTIEHLIDSNQDQITNDKCKLEQLFLIFDKQINHLWLTSYYDKYKTDNNTLAQNVIKDFRKSIINIIEKNDHYSQFGLSPIANEFIQEKIRDFSTLNIPASFIDDFNQRMNINVRDESQFQIKTIFHCHHQSNENLTKIFVSMCAFEPNTRAKNILATCGGHKVCFIDCDTCEVTHIYEMAKFKNGNETQKNITQRRTTHSFSCMCWIEIEDTNENLKILAVGATNGHIYLLSPKWKVMFSCIELPDSSISCITWNNNLPFILVIGSYHHVRFINIRPYINRLQNFARKLNKPTIQFDYEDTSMFVNQISITHTYNIHTDNGPFIKITDLLFYPLSKTHIPLLVGTTSGLFVIQHQGKSEQPLIQLAFPKSIWTLNEHIQSLNLVEIKPPLIAMNIHNHEQIYFIDFEKSLQRQQLCIHFSISNPFKSISIQMALSTFNNQIEQKNESFECIIANDSNSFCYYQFQSNSQEKLEEISFPKIDTPLKSIISSANLNENYLCFTTHTNLVYIFKRQ